MGFFDGATGVVTKPVEGAKEEGVGGFFKGVGKGLVGVVARPTGGIVDFASGTFDSVKRVAEVTEEVSRVRPARFLHPDRVVGIYNLKEAMGNKILKDLEKGRYADSDAYVVHDSLDGGKHSVFLVTNKRVMFVVHNQVLGTWTVDWEFEYSAIEGPPPTGMEDGGGWYLVIKPREERKRVLGFFGGGDRGKKVFVTGRDVARNMARVIESMRTGHN
jgi:vacuolar protein sorting-associated protein 13A/C